MPQNTGTIIVKADGQSFRAKAESITFKPGGMKRVPIMADGRVVGYSEVPVAASMSFDMVHDSETDVDWVRVMTDATVVAEMDSGQFWQIDNAFVDADSLEIGDAGKGMKVTLMGEAAVRTK